MFDEVPRPEINAGPADIGKLIAMSGLDIMRATMSGDLPAPTIAETMNFWIHRADEGEAEFRGEPTPAHMNPLGTVHGGWAMALLDSVLGCAVHTTCAPGEGFVSMDTSVKFVRPLMPGGGQVRAVATVQTRGRRVANVEGRVETRDGKVIALGTSTCFIQQIGG
ncbi:PaaI family thioesterase [Maritimibacter sp. UBA3975]|uniref:PaaI family thioesterase n=1 Tax=Maritimibacter sp. UBA3975 TaxID=1946833 RepID=UPI000C0A5003|nr:PaaI family thioesterase [Maritimibacter sp. UBA3975]MAM62027.1 phenylacetic acid degradation protein [Maritimibacter sp.]|tara:strand:- start:20252 stop:20746 length:495 start_codon:yes stop_codon:yes gene_type:complete